MRKKTKLWFHKLVSGAIGGGAGAVTSTITASIIAPSSFNLSSEIGNFFKLAGATFAVNAFLSVMLYLRQSPLPPASDDPTRTWTKEELGEETKQ